MLRKRGPNWGHAGARAQMIEVSKERINIILEESEFNRELSAGRQFQLVHLGLEISDCSCLTSGGLGEGINPSCFLLAVGLESGDEAE